MKESKRTILAVCLNPTLQITMTFSHIEEGEVNRAKFHRLDASGKGMNVARVATQLGSHASLLTHLGGLRSEEFRTMASDDGVTVLHCDSESPIRTCITLLQEKDASTTELVQESVAVAATTEAKIRALYTEALKEQPVVVFSGTRAPGYTDVLYVEMVKEAKAAGCYVILDYRGKDLVLSLEGRPDVIKPNLFEFWQTFFPNEAQISEQGDSEHLKDRVSKKMAELYTQYGINTIITRGENPLWAYANGTMIEREALAITAVNTIGCGDAFTAGFAHAIATGGDFMDATDLGLHAAARNASVVRPGSLTD